MLSGTRIKIAGAGLAALALFAGHEALPVRADAPGADAGMIVAAEASDAADMAADPLSWTDPNTTCSPSAIGHPILDGVDLGVAQVSAEEAAEASVTCFSLTHSSYTMTVTLSIQEYTSSGSWVNLCTTGAHTVAAVAGLATDHMLLECYDKVSFAGSGLHAHRAHVDFTATTGSRGHANSATWLISY